jgi:two-component system CAI-1 autoinducer sensor kinase/phosphatase CqsS
MKTTRGAQIIWPAFLFRTATNEGADRHKARGRYLRLGLRRARVRMAATLSQSVDYSRANIVLFGLFGATLHPVYYLLWAELFPQPFESLGLRLFSAGLCIPMLFEPQLARYQWWRRILPIYWLTMATYQLPFFFMFMSFMNGFSIVWDMSTMAACLFLVLLITDWLLLLLIALIGAATAWLAFLLTGAPLAIDYSAFDRLAPIYLFALIGGSVFNYKSEVVAREKLAAITAAVGTIAHELRTPLLGIRSGARGVQRYFPAILEGYELARQHGLPVRGMRAAHYREMQSVLTRIVAETEYSSVILDMLLINSSRQQIDRTAFTVHRISDCIATALEHYPFQNADQRHRVRWERSIDFAFLGSDVFMVHVLFNLLKNALYFLDRVADGQIIIAAERLARGGNRLRFTDTGPGIAPEVLPRIFDRFYSGMPQSQGTGIGLAFARLVMHSFDGDITCRSELGRFTEFVMTFPKVESDDHD